VWRKTWFWLAIGLAGGLMLIVAAMARRDERMLVLGYAALAIGLAAPVFIALVARHSDR
jgi:hypothetical protein